MSKNYNSEIVQSTLPNGMQIRLKEIHTAPIISQWIWYRVGSRMDPQGKTGITHWVEHMQFKGTPRFPSSILDKAISRTGGIWNAFTHLDWPTYYETLPADQIDLALELESDRMQNSNFDSAGVESERSVILSELDGSLNEPLFRLAQAIQSASFDHHPYRNEIIGKREDLLHIDTNGLLEHYRQYYTPSNAILTMAGDFNPERMLEKIHTRFEALPSKTPPVMPSFVEPPLTSEKRVTIEGPGSTTYLQLAYRAPAARELNFFAFSILDSLLCGPTSLNMFGGGGISNKTSRLYKALVEKEFTAHVRGGMQATVDPFLFELNTTLLPNTSPDAVLKIIDGEIQRLQETLVTQKEIARAIKQARALFAYGSENITNQAFWLGYAEMFDNYSWFTHYVDHLETITPEDVQQIAQRYLNTGQRVVGIYLPGNGNGSKGNK